jgi:hypothetical protein
MTSTVSAALGDGTFLLATTAMPAISSPVAINFSQALAAGQSVYFTLGANGSCFYDSTGIQLPVDDGLRSLVPEPSTVVLLSLGAAALWFKRRSQV